MCIRDSSSSLPSTKNQESVVELSFPNEKKEASEQPRSEVTGSTVQPQSAETLQTLLNESEQETLKNDTDTLETQISKLDHTLLKLDQQLTDKGIAEKAQKPDSIEIDSSSQQQRIQAIKDHLETRK